MTWYVSFSSCTCCQKCELIFTQSYTIEIWCHTSLCWRKRHSSWMHYIHNWNTDGLWFCGNVKLHLPAFLYGFFSVCSKHALQTTNHRLWKRQEQDIKIIRDPIGKKSNRGEFSWSLQKSPSMLEHLFCWVFFKFAPT